MLLPTSQFTELPIQTNWYSAGLKNDFMTLNKMNCWSCLQMEMSQLLKLSTNGNVTVVEAAYKLINEAVNQTIW